MFNHMKGLLGLLIVLTGLAYWLSQKDPSGGQVEQPLVPDWQADLSQLSVVDQVSLSKAGETINLAKGADGWVLNDGFYATVEPLYELLQGISRAVIVEAKTANPENHELLELSAQDLVVKISAGDEQILALNIGKTTAAGHVFVRRVDEDQTYTVSGLKPVRFNTDSWQLKTVLDVDASDIQAVKLTPHTEDSISVLREAATGEWQIENMPEGYQLKANAYLEQLSASLSRFIVDDALVKDTDELNEMMSAEYVLSNGDIIKLQVYQGDEEYFVTIHSDAYPQYQNWMMKIAEYKFTSLNRSLTEFIEPSPSVGATGVSQSPESSGLPLE
ncbi:DUF4340 domain-containing protein [Marinicella sp. S1101]|uniref:DUF4340 domain-containing protein n=1 Tax=Marinicella marina TaxID=2996016 RepID=UPI002260E27B|nr:DUF4340 domain-containing protein [Marinicella marina]MCX7553561.1 DUF4340 domain-containing protein [Marinicella marina]MDJ1140185.1 DUF4340 domain-containing protein [Marinicella marina]